MLGSDTRYAVTVDGVHIAYQVHGAGPEDLVFVPGFVSNVERGWAWPQMAEFMARLATFSRLIIFDRRGTGLSDRVVPSAQQLTLEARMEDIRAVLDAVGSKRATLMGFEEGFALCAVFAASDPGRVASLVAFAPSGLGLAESNRPWALSESSWAAYLEWVRRGWGTLAFATEEGRRVWPDIHDPEWFRQYAAWMRQSVSPGDAVVFLRVDAETDVDDILDTIRVPTLVMQRTGDAVQSVEYARYFARRIPGAILDELPGSNHAYVSPDQDEVLDRVERFVTALRDEAAVLDRVLATVLFTDIVGSTDRAAALGDHAWRDLLERHHATVRAMLGRYRGVEVDTAGDGFFATFDGPARAVRCAQEVIRAVRSLGLEVRAGVHTGEVALIDGKAGGIAVVIGARIGAKAGPSEVLVSSTVKDLVIGSGLTFEDAGEHDLKGVPDRWRLYRVQLAA